MQSVDKSVAHEGTTYPVVGFCDVRFAGLRDRFCDNFAQGLEIGAAVAVTLDGKPVVDLWGGYADKVCRTPWARDTITNMQSLGKGIAAICIYMLVDRGQLDPDKPVADYWPEFAAAGKATLPLRYILDHRAGLAYTTGEDARGVAYTPGAVAAALAHQAPIWEPGTQSGYHAVTMGLLLSEIVRRITGKTLGQFLQSEIATPLGLDYFFGVPATDLARCAEAVFPPSRGKSAPGSNEEKIGAVWPPGLDYNSAAYRMAEMPSNNGHGNARSVARLYAALALGGELDGVRLMKAATLARMTTEQHNMEEIILKRRYHQASGVILNSPPFSYMGPNPRAFGHHGSGGPMGFADPDARLSFSYAINRYHDKPIIGPRRDALVDATFASL